MTPTESALISLLACERKLGRIDAIEWIPNPQAIRLYGPESSPERVECAEGVVRYTSNQDYIEITPLGDTDFEGQYKIMLSALEVREEAATLGRQSQESRLSGEHAEDS